MQAVACMHSSGMTRSRCARSRRRRASARYASETQPLR